MLQQLDLSQSALGQNLLAEDVGDLFDSDAFAGLVVGGRTGGEVSMMQGRKRRRRRRRRRGCGGAVVRTRLCRRRPGPVPW